MKESIHKIKSKCISIKNEKLHTYMSWRSKRCDKDDTYTCI